MTLKKSLLSVVCFLLIFLWVYTSVSKLANYESFVMAINNQPFPNTWTPFLVKVIPASELITAALLIPDTTRLLGLCVSSLLLTLFTGYILLVLSNRFGYVPCSCGGVIQQLNWKQHLAFNLFFEGITIAGIILHPSVPTTIKIRNRIHNFLHSFMHENRGSRKPV